MPKLSTIKKQKSSKKMSGKYNHVKSGQTVVFKNGSCAKRLSNGQFRFVKKSNCNKNKMKGGIGKYPQEWESVYEFMQNWNKVYYVKKNGKYARKSLEEPEWVNNAIITDKPKELPANKSVLECKWTNVGKYDVHVLKRKGDIVYKHIFYGSGASSNGKYTDMAGDIGFWLNKFKENPNDKIVYSLYINFLSWLSKFGGKKAPLWNLAYFRDIVDEDTGYGSHHKQDMCDMEDKQMKSDMYKIDKGTRFYDFGVNKKDRKGCDEDDEYIDDDGDNVTDCALFRQQYLLSIKYDNQKSEESRNKESKNKSKEKSGERRRRRK